MNNLVSTAAAPQETPMYDEASVAALIRAIEALGEKVKRLEAENKVLLAQLQAERGNRG